MADLMTPGNEGPEAVWATLAVTGATLHGQPDSTINPRDKPIGTTARGALERFVATGLEGITRSPLELGPILGEGGMGVVHLANQPALGREVAVKSLRPQRRGPGPTLKLLQEAWTAARLEHPNIVPVYDITVGEDGSPRVVLKRIEGESFAAILHNPAAVVERDAIVDLLEWKLQVLSSVCNAIEYAHDHGVLHLDIKPENIMVGGHGEVYVVDWGVAMALEDDGSGRLPLAARNQDIVGTPSYIAPEMLAPTPGSLSTRTDVYLLGATLFEILADRPPHRGATLMEVLHAAVFEEPELPAKTPAELASLCRAAMARDPSERLPSAEALRRGIQAFLRHRESDRLANEAQVQLDELENRLRAELGAEPRDGGPRDDTPDQPDQPDQPSRDERFTRIRFGFEQALASWPQNPVARAGLGRAVEVMVSHALDQEDPQTAALLAKGATLPPELDARLAAALAQHQAGLDELRQLHHDQDLSIGQRTRAFLILLLGLFWSVTPFVEQFGFRPESLGRHLAYYGLPVVSLALLAGLAIWARESMTRTRVNRIVIASLALSLVAQIALLAGFELLGVPPYDSMPALLLVWAVIVAMIALTFEPKAAPIALSYFAGFFAAAWLPDWRFFVMGVCNVIFMVVLLIAWRPERMTDPPAEPAPEPVA